MMPKCWYIPTENILGTGKKLGTFGYSVKKIKKVQGKNVSIYT